MDSVLYKERFLKKSEKSELNKEPFYSEENWNAMIKAKRQLDRGEGIIFDIEKIDE